MTVYISDSVCPTHAMFTLLRTVLDKASIRGSSKTKRKISLCSFVFHKKCKIKCPLCVFYVMYIRQ